MYTIVYIKTIKMKLNKMKRIKTIGKNIEYNGGIIEALIRANIHHTIYGKIVKDTKRIISSTVTPIVITNFIQ